MFKASRCGIFQSVKDGAIFERESKRIATCLSQLQFRGDRNKFKLSEKVILPQVKC